MQPAHLEAIMLKPIALTFALLTASSASAGDAAWLYSSSSPASPNLSIEKGLYMHNPTGERAKVMRKSTGVYTVHFAGMTAQARGGNVQVTAYGSGPEHCKVEGWSPVQQDMTIRVRCFRGAQPSDSNFTVLFEGSGDTATTRYAWAGRPTTPSYTANADYAQANGGVQITRLGLGNYTAQFPGVPTSQINGGNVQVTAYGAQPTLCKVERWTTSGKALKIHVRCFDASGRPADSPFTVLHKAG